jgi:hypothetical protein
MARFTLTVDSRWLGVRTVDVPDSLSATRKVDSISAKVETEFRRIYREKTITIGRPSRFEAIVVVSEPGIEPPGEPGEQIDRCSVKAIQIQPTITLRKRSSLTFEVCVDGMRVGDIEKDHDGHVVWTHNMAGRNFDTKDEAARDLVSGRIR